MKLLHIDSSITGANSASRQLSAASVALAGGKHVIVASSRGGLYAPGMPFEANDLQEKYLRAIFAFLGIGDIEIIRAEGLALSPAHREAALNTAHATIPTSVAARKARRAA